MSYYTPDKWVIIRLTANTNPGNSGSDHIHHRIMASWFGGYLSGDSWKMSSGIEGCQYDLDGNYIMPQTSGSTYVCHESTYGLSGYASGVLASYIKKADESNGELNIHLLTASEASEYLLNLTKATD